jgi:hypothetical protein
MEKRKIDEQRRNREMKRKEEDRCTEKRKIDEQRRNR